MKAHVKAFGGLLGIASFLFVFLSCPLPTKGIECPEGSVEIGKEVVGEEVRIKCKCLPGRVLINNKCVKIKLLRIKLEKRYKDALNGLSYSLDAWKHEALAYGYTTLSENILLLMPGVLALVKAPGPTLTATVLGTLVAVTNFLAKYPNCSFKDASLKGICENTKRFSEIARNTAEKLKALPQ